VAFTPVSFQVTELTGGYPDRNVPANANAVTGVLTIKSASYKGWLAITPEPDPAPLTSTINFPANDTRSTGVTVPIGSGGMISVTYGAPVGNTIDVIFELTGYFVLGTGGSTYVTLTPARLLDSRPTGSGHTNVGLSGTFTAGTARTFAVTGALPAPLNRTVVPTDAIAVTGTLTVTNHTAAGTLTIGPDALDTPIPSLLASPTATTAPPG
jgi:hypothetical protein